MDVIILEKHKSTIDIKLLSGKQRKPPKEHPRYVNA
jgi:hypothetical protein